MDKNSLKKPSFVSNEMRLRFVYLIHFDEPWFHAQHYLGATENLPQRMQQHHQRGGSKLIQAINELGIGWTLAQLWIMQGTTNQWTQERHAKAWKCAPRHCPICNPRHALRLQGALIYPIANLPPSIPTRREPCTK